MKNGNTGNNLILQNKKYNKVHTKFSLQSLKNSTQIITNLSHLNLEFHINKSHNIFQNDSAMNAL